MDRIIKFRGKRIDNGKWVYGFYVGITAENTHEKHSIISINNAHEYEVDPITVGQFTGFKDKNGNEIYEQDIVRCTYANVSKVNFVYFNNKSCGFYFDELDCCVSPIGNWIKYYSIEIIGNTYDNFELLKC